MRPSHPFINFLESVQPTIDITADGSPTLYRDDIDEHYHSMFGAISESLHVYVNSGFRHFASTNKTKRPICVFEVGLGTGLNAALTAMTAIPCHYTAIEKFPLDDNLVRILDFGNEVDWELLRAVHEAPWDKTTDLSPTFRLLKIENDFLTYDTLVSFDVIYMDAFAPEKQPELWTEKALSKLVSMLAPGGVITTYCAKGRIRRFFEGAGFNSERLPGPPCGKREILRLTKPIS